MQQTNATVTINPARLNRPLRPWFARVLHSFVAKFEGIPEDCYSVVCRVFKTDGLAHFDIPVGLAPDGEADAYVIGTCFPDVGAAFYEVHAYDASGNMTALGRGEITVESFTATGSPIDPGQSVPVMQIADSTGALHTISAVSDGEGGYTSIIDA